MTPPSTAPSNTDHVEVAVVGAGLSGLVAARRLASTGRDVVVFEARDRVGGRISNVEVDGITLEAGAQFVGPGQDRVARLAEELGVDTYPAYDRGDPVLEVGGRTAHMRGPLPPLGPLAATEVVLAARWLVRTAQRLPGGRPWDGPDARLLDGETFATWIDRHLHGRVPRGVFRAGCRVVFSAEPEQVSLLHVLFFVRFADGVVPLVAGEGGAHERRFVGGSGRLPQRLADGLEGHIRLGEPVRRLEQTADRVVLTTGHGTCSADAVIVAVPPALAARLDVTPALPSARQQLLQRLPMGQAVKVQATYPTPFWRADGRSGQLLSDIGPCSAVFDNTPPGSGPGVLMGFVTGRPALRFLTLDPAHRRAAALGSFARAAGPAARRPRDYVEHDWTGDPWTRGGYFGVPGPGMWSQVGHVLRTPVGRIHWAGTETAERWFGYLDGAVEAGERAADEVVQRLTIERARPGSDLAHPAAGVPT
ncbi:flavin monoamine oxidase family protein [Egicoccus halophilus]|uniref:Monoamine oxidase n=1 Tax=Egicoccus halophilus TaxID=1670830 RepID=A0A8J3AFL2_9ACTN|nr:flavin monoamine oxidase family protein [Egicoccus halophilus]GGI08074.1 monoamine oxidase [Egicoccus halophilus]